MSINKKETWIIKTNSHKVSQNQMQILPIEENNVYIYVNKCDVCVYASLHVILHNHISFIVALESSVSPITHYKSRDVCPSGKLLFTAVWLFSELKLPQTIAITSQTQCFCYSLYSQKGKHFLWSRWKGSRTILGQALITD